MSSPGENIFFAAAEGAFRKICIEKKEKCAIMLQEYKRASACSLRKDGFQWLL